MPKHVALGQHGTSKETPMRIGLKWWLLGLCGLGAFIGMMGNWLLRSPEEFFAAIMFCSTIVPFALAIGTIIWLGLKPQLRPGVVAWGASLVLFPILLQVGVALLLPSNDPLRILSTRRLIETRLPARVNEPWVWNELERRMAAGDLSQEDVDAALEKLVQYMRTNSPQGWNQPFHWQQKFITTAKQAKLLSPESYYALCDAFYGPQPVVRPVPSVDVADSNFSIYADFGNPWSDNTGLGVELLWQVTGVSLNGAPLKFTQSQSFGRNTNMTITAQLPEGEHQVLLTVECAYVDKTLLAGPQFNPLPINQWPTARKRWRLEVPVSVKVERIFKKGNGDESP
jgi:hypothetical protein